MVRGPLSKINSSTIIRAFFFTIFWTVANKLRATSFAIISSTGNLTTPASASKRNGGQVEVFGAEGCGQAARHRRTGNTRGFRGTPPRLSIQRVWRDCHGGDRLRNEILFQFVLVFLEVIPSVENVKCATHICGGCPLYSWAIDCGG